MRRIKPRGGFLGDPPIVWLFWAAYVAVAVGAVLVVGAYGGASFWPVLVGSFGASLGAFVLALTWDGERDRRFAQRDEAELHQRLVTEARRRLGPLRKELERNKKSLDGLVLAFASGGVPAGLILHPELLEGAWSANAPRLSEILANFELTSDLASTYGRIEELRWRLRQRTALIATDQGLAAALAGMTKGLVDELAVEVADVLPRVDAAIADPPVQLLGVMYVDAVTSTISFVPSSLAKRSTSSSAGEG